MRVVNIKKCKKCGKMYKWVTGGVVASPKDFADRGMCPLCRMLKFKT